MCIRRLKFELSISLYHKALELLFDISDEPDSKINQQNIYERIVKMQLGLCQIRFLQKLYKESYDLLKESDSFIGRLEINRT